MEYKEIYIWYPSDKHNAENEYVLFCKATFLIKI
jgi:hypothetical protein